MFATAIDRGDQLRKGHASLVSDLFQALPELVFKADARLVACNDNRALENRRRHDFSSRMITGTMRVSPRPNCDAVYNCVLDWMGTDAELWKISSTPGGYRL